MDIAEIGGIDLKIERPVLSAVGGAIDFGFRQRVIVGEKVSRLIAGKLNAIQVISACSDLMFRPVLTKR
ncbi:MAG TPA: hypothetical protein PK228_21920 [Saprospiraceae bacterium]|nr:hypothetical protein [Saprospiraceae bacterium]